MYYLRLYINARIYIISWYILGNFVFDIKSILICKYIYLQLCFSLKRLLFLSTSAWVLVKRKEGKRPGEEGQRCWNLKSKCQSCRPWLLGKLTDRTCIFLKVLFEWLGVQIANKNLVQGDELVVNFLLEKPIIS